MEILSIVPGGGFSGVVFERDPNEVIRMNSFKGFFVLERLKPS